MQELGRLLVGLAVPVVPVILVSRPTPGLDTELLLRLVVLALLAIPVFFLVPRKVGSSALLAVSLLILKIGTGPFNKISIQVTLLAILSVELRKPGWFGRDHDVCCNNVHVVDLADLYILVLGT